MLGRYSTVKLAVAKFTEAFITPSWYFTILSVLPAHEAQVIPRTGKVFFTVETP